MVKDKVRQAIDRHKLFQPKDKVLVGVSGGPDSLCLLHALLQFRGELGIEIYVAHLNHGLRFEAAQEFEFVRSISKKWGLPFYGARIDTAYYRQKKCLSVQAAARFCRYLFFKKAAAYFGANKIATAHHRDDQVETILMNIINGAGSDGLAGIKVIRRWKGVDLVRPLLETGKDEIIAYCHENGLEPVCDPSNLEPVYLRNKIRLELIPYLAREYNPQIGAAISRLSALAGEEGAYLYRRAFLYYRKHALEQGKDKVILDAVLLSKLHPALRRRVLRIAWQRINRDGGTAPENKHIEALEHLLRECQVGKEIQLPRRRRAYITAAGLVMATELRQKKSPMEEVVLNVPGITSAPDIKGVYETVIEDPRELSWPPDDRREAYLDYERLNLPLVITGRWAGARFRPLGMDGRKKKLKDYLIDRKVPRQERDRLPLVVSGTDIVWVTGLGIAHPFRITPGTRQALVIRFKPDHKKGKDEEC